MARAQEPDIVGVAGRKQFVEKFLGEERMQKERAVESLAQQSLDKLGKLEAEGEVLKDKLEKLEQGLLEKLEQGLKKLEKP